MRPTGVGCRANRAEAVGDTIGLNCDEFGRAAWRSWKAVLVEVLGCKHLLDSFYIRRVVNVARLYGDILLVAARESAKGFGFSLSAGGLGDILVEVNAEGESGFSLSVCGLVDILTEDNPEWESWAQIGIAVENGCGSARSECSSPINSASVISPNPSCHAASSVVLCSPYDMTSQICN